MRRRLARLPARPRPVAVALLLTASVLLSQASASGTSGPTAGPHAAHEGPVAEMAMGAGHLAVPASATAPYAPTLVPTGWTASASDQETAAMPGQAANALDGDPATAWHSRWSPSAPVMPHRLTIDMGAAQPITGLTYLPEQSGTAGARDGTIAGFRVLVSTDATTWRTVASGTWAGDPAAKTVSFSKTTVRYVRLTALSSAGGGPWASAAELQLLGVPPVAPAPLLPRDGWTASGSDAETAKLPGAAANVLDGSAATAWYSRRSPSVAPMPHWVVLDLKNVRSVSGLTYTPLSTADGAIGQYAVSVRGASGAWSAPVATGTWAADSTPKTVSFALRKVRYVRLTALSAAAGGKSAAMAELDLRGPVAPPPPPVVPSTGSWGPTLGFPIVPSSSALLPDGKVLVWSAWAADTFGGDMGYTLTATLDPVTGQVTQRTVTETGHDMFCPGVAVLPDGRIMVTGGSSSSRTSIYDPADGTWTSGGDMKIARGYHAMTTLPSGEVFTIGGSWSGGVGGKDGEVWSPATGWRLLPGVPVDPILTAEPEPARSDNHAWLFPLSGGRLLQAGPSATMHWITTSGDGSITSAGPRADAPDQMNGSAVYYDVDKLLTLGGSPAYDNSPATAHAYTVDLSGPTPVTTRVGDLATPRSFQNSVVLPDGTVLVLGGQSFAVPFTDTTSALTPELWDPATGRFTPLATGPTPRNYHSIALLLPDARVLSAGGGQCGGACATNHPDGQIFTPPYLLNPDGSPRPRPAITSAPTAVAPGASLSVTTSGPVSAFSLVRTGEATHGVDNDQRRIPLQITAAAGTTYSLAVPADTGVVLPGPYMLFALDAAGVPSVAASVSVG